MEKDTDERNFMLVILEIMIAAQNTEATSGVEKKAMVLHQLRQVLDKETFDRYGPVFGLTIDLLKMVSHDKTMLKGLKSLKTGWLSCMRL